MAPLYGFWHTQKSLGLIVKLQFFLFSVLYGIKAPTEAVATSRLEPGLDLTSRVLSPHLFIESFTSVSVNAALPKQERESPVCTNSTISPKPDVLDVAFSQLSLLINWTALFRVTLEDVLRGTI